MGKCRQAEAALQLVTRVPMLVVQTASPFQSVQSALEVATFCNHVV